MTYFPVTVTGKKVRNIQYPRPRYSNGDEGVEYFKLLWKKERRINRVSSIIQTCREPAQTGVLVTSLMLPASLSETDSVRIRNAVDDVARSNDLADAAQSGVEECNTKSIEILLDVLLKKSEALFEEVLGAIRPVFKQHIDGLTDIDADKLATRKADMKERYSRFYTKIRVRKVRVLKEQRALLDVQPSVAAISAECAIITRSDTPAVTSLMDSTESASCSVASGAIVVQRSSEPERLPIINFMPTPTRSITSIQ